jgi:Spy/CpxP family protein refolding chaperone
MTSSLPRWARRASAFAALVLFAMAPVAAQAQNADIPRTPTGRPDFNGIWQALGNAH